MIDPLLPETVHIIISLPLPGLEFVFQFILVHHINTLISVVEVVPVRHQVVHIIRRDLSLVRILPDRDPPLLINLPVVWTRASQNLLPISWRVCIYLHLI